MGIEAFPEIENFQKLPRQVIVKGGTSTFTQQDGAQLHGIVINNIGHPIQDLRVHAVIFDRNKLPLLSTSTPADPIHLPQGGIASFTVKLEDHHEQISDYHLYTSWKFDERE